MENNVTIKKEPYWNNESVALIMLCLNDTISPKLENLKNLKQNSITKRLICCMEKILQYRNSACNEVLALLDKHTSLKQFFDYLTYPEEYNDLISRDKLNQHGSELYDDFIFTLIFTFFLNDNEDKKPIDDIIADFLIEYKSSILTDNSYEYNVMSLDGIVKLLNDMSINNKQKLLFIDFYIDRDNVYNEFCSLRDDICKVCQKYFYIIEDEHNRYYETITSKENVIEKIYRYFRLELPDNTDSVLYISIGFYGMLSLRFINNKYVYILGAYLFDYMEVKSLNVDESIISDLKVLSDPTRFKIVRYLINREMYLQEIATVLELTPATISHHIGLLLDAEYLFARVNTELNKRVYYGVNKSKIENIINMLQSLIN